MNSRFDTELRIGARRVAADEPTYFIADVASNHDGDLSRARELIHLCGDAGADAVKFQHFEAGSIVSDYGFRDLGGRFSHQSAWAKPVYEVYEEYQLERTWTEELARTAADVGIDFMTTPYDAEAVNLVAGIVPAMKIGSGDITWSDMLERVADLEMPVLLASGASEMEEVERAVATVLARNRALCLMQCNTNYTGSLENFRYVNLRVLETFAARWPGMVLGLSDHTPGHAAVLGAVALGARVVEKHFTDDVDREGPDHSFSMDPPAWREMVDRTRELEHAFGDGIKRLEPNEVETVVVQRRCLRARRDLPAGHVLGADDLEALRPAPAGAVPPFEFHKVVGRVLAADKPAGDAIRYEDLG